MTVIFLLMGIILIICSMKIHKTWINPFTVLCMPYVFVVAMNKIYGENKGFYSIGENTLLIIGLGLISFFIGTMIISVRHSTSYSHTVLSDNSEPLYNYRIDAMANYSIFILVLGYIKLGSIVYTQGIYGLTQEGTLVAGLFGHLLFTIYPLQPLLLLYWLKNKKDVKFGMVVLFTALLLSASFVKYHIICFFVMCYLFLVLTVRKYFKKATVTLLVGVVALFIINYVVGFVSQNILNQVSRSFYSDHLWKYVAGAVINGDAFHDGVMGGNATVGYKLMTFLFALPNMFIQALTGNRLFPREGLRMISVSRIGEYSNVTDAISYMYPITGGFGQVIAFVIYYVILGLLMEMIFTYGVAKTEKLHISIATIFSFFLFFSFFGTFYINEMPWEIAIYSVVVVQLFSKNIRFRFR